MIPMNCPVDIGEKSIKSAHINRQITIKQAFNA